MMRDTGQPLPILVTQGDPSGIGLDITLTAWAQRHDLALPSFVLLATPEHVTQRAYELGLDVPLSLDNDTQFSTHLPVLPLQSTRDEVPLCKAGMPSSIHAPAILEAIEKSVNLIQHNQARAVVTNPIAKHVLKDAGFTHPGHTEYLAALCQQTGQPAPFPVMMIWSGTLSVVPLTIHEPLHKVPELITLERIITTARIIHHDLQTRFGLENPRIAVAGLNPHAGENGYIGNEEQTIIAPAIAALQAEGISITGPHSADTLFHEPARRHYDVALCMYHDQALIPVKTLAFDTGVNVTLGLPIIRTSPDHGTAFDVAGTGRANPSSFIEAVRLAHRLSCATS
jgi:4-hydroxythreonine-4-phosphate dehydrogenase